jgi:hypothetical protein
MTQTVASSAAGDASQARTDESASTISTTSGIRRLNPADGLFLRAEHLDQMQMYARALALAGGIAGGTGVVYGYGLTLEGAAVHVTPGLAIDPSGAPLRTGETVSVPLAHLDTQSSGRFWIIEVIAGPDQPADSEPVYGNLCADPCSVTSIQPWLDSSVRIQVTANDTLPLLASVAESVLRRNWLASAFYEKERRDGRPWLTPGQSGQVAAINALPWSGPQPGNAPSPAGVPIGALLRVDDEWVLDVWTARRDLVATPPRDAWEWRLGLRPWAVFVAQVLQFQAQLASLSGAASLGQAVFGDAEEFYEVVLKDLPRSRKAVRQAWEDWQRQHRQFTGDGTLRAYGFGELPPAGFLPAGFLSASADAGPLQPQVEAIFGSNVVVRLHHNSADAALRAVTRAQHLDRIPLDQPENKPVVDVWIPDVAADLPAVRTESYGWIAFARGRHEAAAVSPAATDQVKIYAVTADLQHDETKLEQVVDRLAGTNWAGGQLVATLEYPAAEWGVPAPEEQLAAVREAVTKMGQLWGVIGLASTDSRCPLAAARAALLPVGSRTDEPLQLLPTYAATHEGGEEAILLVFGVGLN